MRHWGASGSGFWAILAAALLLPGGLLLLLWALYRARFQQARNQAARSTQL